jgi:segregation and condensation protein B
VIIEENEPPAEGVDAGLLEPAEQVSREHLKGLVEALVFVSDRPVKASELAKSALAPLKLVRELLTELRAEYQPRGVQLDEVAGGWIFRSNAMYAPFVRDVAMKKPVRLTRAQTETLAILAYRQPITRPDIDDIRGVDSGPILRLLLERDLVRILGRKDEPGRPVLYGTTSAFLEFFGLKSLKDLPTLREFNELSEESRRVVERELGDALEDIQASPSVVGPDGSPLSVSRPAGEAPLASEPPEVPFDGAEGPEGEADEDADDEGSG